MITIDGTRVLYNPEFYVMRHFAHAIAPGARRIDTEGSWSGNAVAFANPDGSRVAVVRNPLAQPAALDLAVGAHRFHARLAPESLNTLVCS